MQCPLLTMNEHHSQVVFDYRSKSLFGKCIHKCATISQIPVAVFCFDFCLIHLLMEYPREQGIIFSPIVYNWMSLYFSCIWTRGQMNELTINQSTSDISTNSHDHHRRFSKFNTNWQTFSRTIIIAFAQHIMLVCTPYLVSYYTNEVCLYVVIYQFTAHVDDLIE